MKIEIEAKLRVTDHTALIARLDQLKAERIADMREINIFIDSPDRQLHTTDRGMRVRVIRANGDAPHATITFKGPRQPGKLKSRREIEFNIDNDQAAMDLFAELGLHEVIRFEKNRLRYRLGDCTIELDEVPYLGFFTEIEGPDDQTVLAMRDQLGLADHPLIKSSYVAMLTTYLEDHNINTRSITFAGADKGTASRR